MCHLLAILTLWATYTTWVHLEKRTRTRSKTSKIWGKWRTQPTLYLDQQISELVPLEFVAERVHLALSRRVLRRAQLRIVPCAVPLPVAPGPRLYALQVDWLHYCRSRFACRQRCWWPWGKATRGTSWRGGNNSTYSSVTSNRCFIQGRRFPILHRN